MKIVFVDVMGLTYDGSTLYKRGLGGSESAVIQMSRELAKLGFKCSVYNDCTSDDSLPGLYDGVYYKPLKEIEFVNDCDVLISVRSVAPFAPKEIRDRFKSFIGIPNFENIAKNTTHKVLWMHDTFCDGDDLIEDFIISKRIDEIFTLSDFHTSYITNCNHGRRRMFEVLKKSVYQTRNGITKYIDWVDVKDKDPNLFVYNASVSKGLTPLLKDVWPRFKQVAPEAKLKVIGGYYKFNSTHGPDEQEKTWEQLKQEIDNLDIEFTGIVTQREVAKIIANASYFVYPSAFPETFGISTLESLYYKTPIITCDFGALEETAIDIACYKIPYPIEPNGLFPHINKEHQVNAFVEIMSKAYYDKYLHQQKTNACNQVKDICGWDTVALQWKHHFYHKLGDYLPVDEYKKVNRINTKVRKVFGRRFANKEELKGEKTVPFVIIVVVTPVYNAEKYIEKCIKSVASQDYDNWEMWIVDDCSTDNTVEIAKNVISDLPSNMKIHLIENKENRGALYNQVQIIEKQGNDIIMLLDGDDSLVNDPTIFDMYNNLYNDGAEFTYGSCWSVADNIPLIAQEYPPEVKANKSYRDYKFNWNMPYTHLRTFRGYLFHSYIHNEGYHAFKDDNGNWLKAGGDTSLFYSMIETANPENVVCIPDVVYHYNDANPLNDYKVNGKEQTENANYVIEKRRSDMKKILIAIPTSRYIEPQTFKSIYDLKVPEGYEVDFQYFYGYSVEQVRNLIADWTIKGYDYLFAVDHDISFPSDTLERLISHSKPIVSGIYRQRLEPQILEIYDHNLRNISYEYLEKQTDNLIEIGGCGFGCVLVKKEVLKDVGYPQFVYKSAIDHKNTFSEDLYFCTKARELGWKIYVDTKIICNHHGQKVYKVQ